MKSRKILSLLVASLICFNFLGCAPIKELSPSLPKALTFSPALKPNLPLSEIKQVAVMNFKNYTEDESADQRVATAIAAALVKTRRYQVVERRQIKQILEEMALAQSGALDEKTRTLQAGQLLGVQGIIIGEVTSLKKETVTRTAQFQRGGATMVGVPFMDEVVGINTPTEKNSYQINHFTASVEFNARFIEVSTGKVLWEQQIARNYSLDEGEYEFKSAAQLLDHLLQLGGESFVDSITP